MPPMKVQNDEGKSEDHVKTRVIIKLEVEILCL